MRLTTARPRRENILHTHTRFALITCTFALLTWALPTFGHDTPDIRSGVEKHVSPAEVQQIVNEPRNSLSDYTIAHWHLTLSGPYEGQIGGTPNCIADSYDPETDEYGRWDEEKNSWDLSGCEDENTSEGSSSTAPTDEGSSATTPTDQESSQNEEADGNTPTGGTATTPTDQESSATTPTDQESSQNEEADGNTPTGGTATTPTDEGSSSTAPTDQESSATAPTDQESSATTPTDQESSATDATLGSLTLGSIDIGTFNPAITSYTTSVANDVTETTVTATVNGRGASYVIKSGGAVDDDGVIPLAVGSNVIAIEVSAEDGITTLTYTVSVTRGGPDQQDQTLIRTSSEEEDSEQAFGFAGEVENQAYSAGTAITALVLPEATGGEGEVTYRVFGLPAGLSFDAATRTISGTPTAATDGAVEVAYLAEDSTGAITVLNFSITVNPPLSFGDLFGLLNDGASDAEAANS